MKLPDLSPGSSDIGRFLASWLPTYPSKDKKRQPGPMPAEPMVNFAVHQARAGVDGAPADFEQMIALLVQAHEGSGRRVFSNPGAWGIDVLAGELDGGGHRPAAKYFIRGVAAGQRRQISTSFESAVQPRDRSGYREDRAEFNLPRLLRDLRVVGQGDAFFPAYVSR
jgi:hypothetical protein